MASESLRNSWLDSLTRTEFFVADLRLALLTLDSDGELVEIDAAGYERREIEDFMSDPENGSMANELEIQFDPAQEDWPTIHGLAIFDGPESEDRLMERRINPVSVDENDVLAIEPGALDLTFEPEIDVSFMLDVGSYDQDNFSLVNPSQTTDITDFGPPEGRLEASYSFDFEFTFN